MQILDFDLKKGLPIAYRDGTYIDKIYVIENRISEVVFGIYFLRNNGFISNKLINPYGFVK